MQKDFEGKAVIVTGSSYGIGEAIAIHFAKRGAMVTVCGRTRERLEAVLAKCQEASKDKTKCISVCGDITDPAVQEESLSSTVQHFHRLDVLVCNHAVNVNFPNVSSVTPEEYDLVMNTNLKSTFFLIQKAIPHLEKTKGCIVNMSSLASTVAVPSVIVYSLTKAALDYLTKILALELAAKGIRVNTVNPSFVETGMGRDAAAGDDGLRKMAAVHPLHGRLGTMEEIANVMAFLASDAASFVTGECIKVDGAFGIRGLPR